MKLKSLWKIVKNFHTEKFPYGEHILRRNFRTATDQYGEISYGDIYLRRNFLTAKFPYGEMFYVEISWRQTKLSPYKIPFAHLRYSTAYYSPRAPMGSSLHGTRRDTISTWKKAFAPAYTIATKGVSAVSFKL